MTDAALFDWDGTLLDSRGALLGAWHVATGEVLGRCFPQDAEDERLVFTLPGVELFPRVAGSVERGVEVAEVFQRAYEETSRRIRVFMGVAELLGDLRRAGVLIGVVTSKARPRFEADAERIGLTGLIDVATCAGDTAEHKPDPAPVRHALKALGVEPSRAVMVGDTPVDIAAGRAAGTTAVGVAWGPIGTDGLIEAGAVAVAQDIDELARIVMGDPEMIPS